MKSEVGVTQILGTQDQVFAAILVAPVRPSACVTPVPRQTSLACTSLPPSHAPLMSTPSYTRPNSLNHGLTPHMPVAITVEEYVRRLVRPDRHRSFTRRHAAPRTGHRTCGQMASWLPWLFGRPPRGRQAAACLGGAKEVVGWLADKFPPAVGPSPGIHLVLSGDLFPFAH
jgi:hypothetical protein